MALAKVHSLWCWWARAPRGLYAGHSTKVPRHEDARFADRFNLWHVEHKVSMRVGQITNDKAKSRKSFPRVSKDVALQVRIWGLSFSPKSDALIDVCLLPPA